MAEIRDQEREMNMNMSWYMPTRLITGLGCVKDSAKEFAKLGKSCLIVTGKHSAKACGALADVEAALEKMGIIREIYDGIGQNPRLTDCMEAAGQAIRMGADFIVGIGGGSPLDAAKCIAVLAAHPGMAQEELYALHWPNRPLPVAAVGTTAGTGSEVTKVAVITTPDGRKKSLNDEPLYPALALGDPAYTRSLPELFTRSTAVDALAHCMESYFGRLANVISRAYAVQGIRLLLEQFKKREAEGWEDMSLFDREVFYNASIYGGLAINTTGTLFPHNIGYLLTEQYGVPHGTACAVFLQEFYQYNKEVVPELTERFLKEIACDEDTLLRTIRAVTPSCDITVSEEKISEVHGRWIGNSSIKKCWGEFTPEQADGVLRRLFGEK